MKPLKSVKVGLISFLLIIFIFVLNSTFLGKELKNFFYLISLPIQKTFWIAGDSVSDFLAAIFESQNLKKENEELKLTIQELLSVSNSLTELKKENEILREALNLGLEKEFELRLAEITAKDASEDLILINKGSDDGISEGFPVITQQKVLVGKISEVYKNFSKVLLISNPKSSFDAKILNSEIFGILKGKGNLKIFLDLIPHEKEVKKGDLVVSSALGGVFPEGLLVGQISEVKKLDVESWQTAQVQPAFNVSSAEKLFIVSNFR